MSGASAVGGSVSSVSAGQSTSSGSKSTQANNQDFTALLEELLKHGKKHHAEQPASITPAHASTSTAGASSGASAGKA